MAQARQEVPMQAPICAQAHLAELVSTGRAKLANSTPGATCEPVLHIKMKK